MKISNELKVGIVVVAAIAVGALFWTRTATFNAKPYKVKTRFAFADGIKPDSIVKLSGIEVGRVEKIQFIYEPETKVELTLVLKNDARIHDDSIAFISTTGIVGDAYIGLTPGSSGAPFAKEGIVIPSEDPIEMRKFMRKAEEIADNLDKTLTETRTFAAGLNGVMQDNRAKIDNIATNLEATSQNFKELSDDIRRHPWKLLTKGKG